VVIGALVFARTVRISLERLCATLQARAAAPECALLGVPIQPEDTSLLCVHFQPKSVHRDVEHRE
jgi:hypothetical protein